MNVYSYIIVIYKVIFISSLKQYFLFAIIYNSHRLKMLIVSEQFRCLSSSSSYHFVLCTDRCDVPLGIQDGRITRSMFTASSMYNHYYGPWCARLQAQNRGQTRGGWIVKYRNTKQWLQVDLGTVSIVKRIATQARYDANQWVTSYTVSYSNNGVRFFPYKQARRTRVRIFLFLSQHGWYAKCVCVG